MTKLDGDGKKIVASFTIKVWSDGALSVEGPIDDPEFALACIDNAKDAIRNRRNRKSMGLPNLIVPGRDVSVPAPLHPLIKP